MRRWLNHSRMCLGALWSGNNAGSGWMLYIQTWIKDSTGSLTGACDFRSAVFTPPCPGYYAGVWGEGIHTHSDPVQSVGHICNQGKECMGSRRQEAVLMVGRVKESYNIYELFCFHRMYLALHLQWFIKTTQYISCKTYKNIQLHSHDIILQFTVKQIMNFSSNRLLKCTLYFLQLAFINAN